jgi:hypothetical protein
MTYYEDLTPYQYSARNEPPKLNSLNVGWLSRDKPFSIGETSQKFKDRLFQFCLDEYVVNIARGFHVCEFCSISTEKWVEVGKSRYGEKAHWLGIGNAEIRVLGNSAIYAAPTLIYHYVTEHQYRPPDEFIEAVLTGPLSGSKGHRALLRKFK